MMPLRRALRTVRICSLVAFTLVALASLAQWVRGQCSWEYPYIEIACGGGDGDRFALSLADNYGRWWLGAVDYAGPAPHEYYSWQAHLGGDENAWVLSLWDAGPGRTNLATQGGHGVGVGVPTWFPPILFGTWPLLAALRFGLSRWRLRHRRRHGLCKSCGYNLTGNVSGRCPECGAKANVP
jgi:hypothetical protein